MTYQEDDVDHEGIYWDLVVMDIKKFSKKYPDHPEGARRTCKLCDGLHMKDAYNQHELHGEKHCKWSEMGEHKMKISIGNEYMEEGGVIPKYVTKDSGAREDFNSGARRDTQTGKPRYDLIPPGAMKRVAEMYMRGADKYGESNWEKGMPTSRILASLLRHIEAYRCGDREEDHLAAVVWNALALIHFENTEWDDYETKWMK